MLEEEKETVVGSRDRKGLVSICVAWSKLGEWFYEERKEQEEAPWKGQGRKGQHAVLHKEGRGYFMKGREERGKVPRRAKKKEKKLHKTEKVM